MVVLSSRHLGAEASAYVDPARIVAPRTRRQIASAAVRLFAAREGASAAFVHPAARAALAACDSHGAEAARLLEDPAAPPQAFDACLWRWALVDSDALARTLAQASALDQALSPAFARFIDCMVAATPSASYEALRAAVRRLRAFPENPHARVAVLAQIDTFGFAMMTGPVALRAAIEWSLRGVGDALLASSARPVGEASNPFSAQGFHDLDAPAAYAYAPAEDDVAALLGPSALAEWIVQPEECAERRALVASLARATPAASSSRLEAALEAAAARRALAEAPDAHDPSAATRDVCLVLGGPFIARAAGLSALGEPDRALFIAVMAALASHPVDGRALRGGRVDPCDMTIRFAATAARLADARRAAALRTVFADIYENGVASALAEIASAHACLRGRIADESPGGRIAAGAHLIDIAGFVPRALRAGLALRRLCEADDGMLAHAWRPPTVHTNYLELTLAMA